MSTNSTAAAQAALDAMQALMSTHHEAEQTLIARMESLDVEQKRLKDIIVTAKAALVDALAAGNTKATVSDVTAAQAKLDAIAEARGRFPAELAAHRERGRRMTERLLAAQRTLKASQFEDALAEYRAAMVKVWPLADKVWACGHAAGRSDLPGMADPLSKYGRV